MFIRRIIPIFCTTLLVVFFLTGLSFLVLPGLIQSWMLPELAQQMGYGEFSCGVDSLGLTETSAGPLRLGPKPRPALSIERIRLRYGINSMLNGGVDEIVLSGINLRTVYNNGSLSIAGLPPKTAAAVPDNHPNNQNSNNSSSSDSKTTEHNSPTHQEFPRLPFAKLTIKRSLLFIKKGDRELRIPFSGTITKLSTPETATTRLDGTLNINPRETQIPLNFSVTITKNRPLKLVFAAKKFNLLNFAAIWSELDNLDAPAEISFRAESLLNLSDLSLKKLHARIELHQGELKFKNFHHALIIKPKTSRDEKPPTVLTLNKDENSNIWKLKLNRLAFTLPFAPTIADLEFSIINKPDKTDLQGDWTTSLSLKKQFNKRWRMSAVLDQEGPYNASISSQNDRHKWQVNSDGLSISGSSPSIKINFHGQNTEPLKLDWLVSLNQTLIKNGKTRFLIPKLETGGETEINLSEQTSSSLPVSATKGHLICKKIILNKTDLGIFTATFHQQHEKFKLMGRYLCKVVKELKLNAAGECGFMPDGRFQSEISLNIPPCKPPQPVMLGKLIPTAGKSSIDGTFSAAGKLFYGKKGAERLNGNLELKLNHARFNDPEKSIECRDINGSIKFPELPSLYSAPNQKLNFAQLKIGNISSNGGEVSFQLERDQTLLLEKARIGWCGGNIETQALRFSPKINNYHSTLYCDRLQLTELLKQLGQIEAQGQGSVNGRIPVIWENNKLTFNDGFLYSTPNQTGNIRIKGTSALTAGIPTDSPQFAQLDLAREALKDYQYKWAKLKLHSKDEELILNLQFDGKPNLPLPFIYKKEIGGFVRVSTNGPGSHFQGISLDINLRFPLNHILQYKDLSSIMN